MKMNLAVCMLAAGFAFVCPAAVNMLSCCPGENTATEARFVWHSDSDACLLFCAKASDTSDPHVILPYGKTKKPVAFRKENVTYYKYCAEISDLEPATEYVYWIEAGGETYPKQRFKTAGTNGSWNFLWLSDVHSHPDEPGKMATVELLRQDAEAQTAASGGIDFVLFSGDAVKYGSRYDNWQEWNGAPAVTNYTFALIPGNKEYYYTGSSTFYDYYWYLATRNNPPNGPDATEQEGCYWFLRDSVLFVGIDSLVHKGSRMAMYGKKDEVLAAQTNWFDKVVESQRGKFKWLVVFQHDPWFVYSATHDSFDKSRGNYDTWRRVFDKHKVDLALSGDEHNYIRSKPLKGDAAAEDGTIYMVSGQIEESNYSATITKDISACGNANAAKYFDCMGATDASCGAAWIEVRPDSLKVTEFWDKWQSPDYKVYDTVTVAPKDRGWVFEEIGAAAHSRYRFAVDAPRGDADMMQISEIQLLDENGDAILPSAFSLAWDSSTTNSAGLMYPSDENPAKAADGKLSTKWLDYRAGLDNPAAVRSAAWIDFCFSAPVKISGYRWYTANDDSYYPSRTPAAWTLSAYDDGDGTMYILDRVAGYDPPAANMTLAYPLPETPDAPGEGGDAEDAGPTAAKGVYYALCVGVNNYKNGRQEALEGCVPDAEDVLSACTNAVKGMWAAANTTGLYDAAASKSAVRARFNALAATAKSGDTVLYYHSSHGGDDCICLYDKEYYADDFASDLMQFSQGVRVVVILDTCHSASMFRDAGDSADSGPWDFAASVGRRMDEMHMLAKGSGDAASGPSVGWITACDDDQLSLESGKRGWFTKPFVAAWKAESTDLNGDGWNDFKEMFNIAAPKAVDQERAPQTMNENLLKSVAAWQLSGTPYTWQGGKWIAESSSTPSYTGIWSRDVSYGADGRANLDNAAFTPYNTSTGNVATVEIKAQFRACEREYTPEAGTQGAVRLGANGSFQAWTAGGWVDIAADGFTPLDGEEYTVRFVFDYTKNSYSVEILTGAAEWTKLRVKENPSRGSLPLAASTNCISFIEFVGETVFTSISGECRYEITGFAKGEALVLAGNAQVVLDAAQAAWLNKCAAGKTDLVEAAAGLTQKEFDDAYLLNLDIGEDASYSFKVTDVDVGDGSVTVSVALSRPGKLEQPVNGRLVFYGASTLEAFKTAAAPLSSLTLVDENFSGGDTATATFQKDGNVFFKAKIEEK